MIGKYLVNMKSKKMIYLVISLAIVAVIGLGIAMRMTTLYSNENVGEKYLEINGKKILLEVADTEVKREHGLSDRQSLAPDTGMLFVFDTPGFPEFWMKDMHFPIDMIFLDKDLRVVTTFASAQPSSYPAIFKPTAPAQFVIEVQAGFVEKNHIIYQEQLKIK